MVKDDAIVVKINFNTIRLCLGLILNNLNWGGCVSIMRKAIDVQLVGCEHNGRLFGIRFFVDVDVAFELNILCVLAMCCMIGMNVPVNVLMLYPC